MLGLCALLAPPAWGQVAVQVPAEAPAGQPFDVVVDVDPSVDVAQVELLYRSAATPQILAVLMQGAGARAYRAGIPAEHVVPPQVEVVIRVRDHAGQTRLFFKTEGEQPYAIAVSAGAGPAPSAPAPPTIAELRPAPGGQVVGRRPTLVVRLAPDAPEPVAGQVMVTIDGVDFTPQIEIAGREIRLRPASALAPGPHQAQVVFLDPQGQPGEAVPWPFTIRDWAAVQEGSLGVATSGTYEYGVRRMLGADPRWKANGNMHVEGRLGEGGFRASVDADVRYIDQHPGGPQGTERRLDLASHLFTLLYDQGGARGRFDLGEIGVQETPLTTGGSFARRGAQLTARLDQTEFHAFSTSATPLLGHENFTGLEEADTLVWGGSVSQGLLGERLTVKLTALQGRNAPAKLSNDFLSPPVGQGQQPLQAYNIGAMGGGLEAQTWGVQLSTRLFDGRLRGEVEGAFGQRLLLAVTDSGAEADPRGRQSDEAWRAKLEGEAWGVHAGADYQYTGLNFSSVANPTLVTDREEAGLDLQTSLWLTSWQLRLSQGHDNVRDKHQLPRTSEWKMAPTATLALPDLPVLTLAYMRSDQTVERALEMQPRRILTQGGSAGLSYSAPLWFASLVPAYQLQDAIGPDSETDTRSITFALGLTPAPWLTVSPSYTFTRTRALATHTITDSHVPTLTARVELVPGLLTFDTQSSYTTSSDNKDAVDTTTLAGLARLTLSLKRFFPGGIAPAVSVRADYNRTTDRLVATNRREDYGVFLIFDLFAPFGLLPRPGLDWQPAGGIAQPGAQF